MPPECKYEVPTLVRLLLTGNTKRKHIPNVIAPRDQERVLAAIPEPDRGIYFMAAEELNVSEYDFKTRTETVGHAMDGDTNAALRKTTKVDDSAFGK